MESDEGCAVCGDLERVDSMSDGRLNNEGGQRPRDEPSRRWRPHVLLLLILFTVFAISTASNPYNPAFDRIIALVGTFGSIGLIVQYFIDLHSNSP